MKVRYIGVFADDGVELHETEGALWFPGHTDVEVTAELAARLLDQPANFEPADQEAEALLASMSAPESSVPTGDTTRRPSARRDRAGDTTAEPTEVAK